MKSFTEFIDWAKETGYLKQTIAKGKGGRGGTTEKSKGNRARVVWIDNKKRGGNQVTSTIPPVQYKPAKDKKELDKYIKDFTKWVKSIGGKIKSFTTEEYGAGEEGTDELLKKYAGETPGQCHSDIKKEKKKKKK